MIPDAHRRQTLGYGMAVGGVAVAYEMGGRTIPWEGLGNLPRNGPVERGNALTGIIAGAEAGDLGMSVARWPFPP
jgi:hypothetical protein